MTVPDPREHPLLPVEEAGRVLYGVGRSAAYEHARRGDIPTIRLGRRLMVPTAKALAALGLWPEPENGGEVVDLTDRRAAR